MIMTDDQIKALYAQSDKDVSDLEERLKLAKQARRVAKAMLLSRGLPDPEEKP